MPAECSSSIPLPIFALIFWGKTFQTGAAFDLRMYPADGCPLNWGYFTSLTLPNFDPRDEAVKMAAIPNLTAENRQDACGTDLIFSEMEKPASKELEAGFEMLGGF